jgi:hypothetical protein
MEPLANGDEIAIPNATDTCWIWGSNNGEHRLGCNVV